MAWAALLVSSVGCGDDGPGYELAEDVALRDATPVQCAPSGEVRLDTIARGMEVPWDVTFLPGGPALVTERPGRIAVVDPTEGVRGTWAQVPVLAREEVGLLGIDHHVRDDGAVEVYVLATVGQEGPGWLPGPLQGLRRRLARLRDPERGHVVTLSVLRFQLLPDGSASSPEVVLEGLPSGPIHGGGTLRIGPDGFLWLTSGDAGVHASAQLPGTTRGKLLRYTLDGDPAGVEAGSPVYSSGLRHSQGMAWSPGGSIYLIDHGPTGLASEWGRAGNDELNRVTPGANFGWPAVAGLTEGPRFQSPLVEWTPPVAPAGIALHRAPGRWEGDLFVSSLTTGALRRLEVGSDGEVLCEEAIPLGLGRLRAVANAPDGSLWVSSSNRDGRGAPRAQDDVLVRVRAPDSR